MDVCKVSVPTVRWKSPAGWSASIESSTIARWIGMRSSKCRGKDGNGDGLVEMGFCWSYSGDVLAGLLMLAWIRSWLMVLYVSFDISSHWIRPQLEASKARPIQRRCIDMVA